MDLDEVVRYAVAVTAILAAFLAITRFPPVQRTWDWFNRHRIEDRTARIGEVVAAVVRPLLEEQSDKTREAFQPRLDKLDRRTLQLEPNGGQSIFDRVTKMTTDHDTIKARQDVFDDRLDTFGDRLAGVESVTRTILSTLRSKP